MRAICICASNIADSGNLSTSYRLSEIVKDTLARNEITCEIVDLRKYNLSPCVGCGQCYESKRCRMDQGFNIIYEKIVKACCIFLISPHYAPIPAKLCMLLEKMEQITFLHWWKNNAYRAEVYGIPAGIISHGGGSEWALPGYKAMVNDTIANALDTIQCKIVPYSDEWNTGISVAVHHVEQDSHIFPIQQYEWSTIEEKVREYVSCVVREILQS